MRGARGLPERDLPMTRAWLGLAGILALAAACGRSGVAGAPADDGGTGAQRPVEMFGWVERIGDSDPMAALAAIHQRRNPADIIISARAASSGEARNGLRARMLRDDPPDTFQANVGNDLMQWVLFNGIDALESKVVPLDDLVPDVASWRKAIPAELLDQVSYKGRIYGVPANVHRNNTVFYNKHVFAKFGLTEPKSVADLLAQGRALHDRGVPLLAVGSRDGWTVSLLLFECLLVAREGTAFYRDFFAGRLAPDDRRIVATLQAGLDLLAFANPDQRHLNWEQAVEKVVRGEAAMTVMGEWARGPFIAARMKLGVDYDEMPFPGSSDVFVFSADAFGLSMDASNRAAAARLLATIGSVEGQSAISQARRTLSARTDVPPLAGDPALARGYALLQKGPLLMALSGLVPSRFSGDLDASLGEMIDRRDVEPVVQTLRSRYVLLK
jgi:glucose/mannose transport system substrate-binding protein